MSGAKPMVAPGTHATCASVDSLPPHVRALVHEFGLSVVMAFNNAGIYDPAVVRRLVHAVWLGAREPGNKVSGVARPMFMRTLEGVWPHMHSPDALIGFLDSICLTVAPILPTRTMIAASIAETGNLGLVSKQEKHRARLEAALRANHREWRRLRDA